MNVLLLRGLIRSQFHWWDFKKTLAEQAPDLKPYFLDFPGTGTEFKRESPFSIPEIRADIRRRFQKEIDEGRFPQGPWALVAKSMGGMVGIDWVTHHPADFKKLILINSSAKNAGGIAERFNIRALPQVLKNWLVFDPHDGEKLILDLTVNREELKAKYLERAVKLRHDYPITRRTFAAQIFAASRATAPLSLPLPTLVLASTHDRLVSVECSKRLAARFEAQIEIHPTAGHDLSIDDPQWLADQMADFLKTEIPYTRRPS